MRTKNVRFTELHKWSTTFDIKNDEGYPVRWGARLFRLAFGKSGKLPVTDKIQCKTVWSNNIAHLGIVLYLHPSNPRGCRTNRVRVLCDKCGRTIPAGRIAQHTC